MRGRVRAAVVVVLALAAAALAGCGVAGSRGGGGRAAGAPGPAPPAGAATSRTNAARYVARLRARARRLAAEIAPFPPARRLIVTDHDAFGYFAARYGIRVVGTVIPSLSTAAEPDARQLTRLAKTIRRTGVHAVFSEQSVNPRVERAIASEAGARVGRSLYGDSLGPAGSPGATYIGMMRANMTSIIDSLRGG